MFHHISKKRLAEKAVEPVGHTVRLSPIPLVSQIKKFLKKTILRAGCISTGGDIASAMQMGVD